jgi:hypothetical protein
MNLEIEQDIKGGAAELQSIECGDQGRGLAISFTPEKARELHCAYPGEPGQVRRVREDITRAFDWCPLAGDMVLIASELATNAIRHSRSGRGGQFTVTVRVRPGSCAWVSVEDQGGGRGEQQAPPDADGSLGQGLVIVGALAGEGNWGLVPLTWTRPADARSDSRPDTPGHLAWARIPWPPAGRAEGN